MAAGDITDYDELIDVANNFNPSTGVFTVGNQEEDKGTYVFLFSGHKSRYYGKKGSIQFHKNGVCVQATSETDDSHDLHIDNIMSINLDKGDQIKLYNYYDASIYVNYEYPFTFTGFKV